MKRISLLIEELLASQEDFAPWGQLFYFPLFPHFSNRLQIPVNICVV